MPNYKGFHTDIGDGRRVAIGYNEEEDGFLLRFYSPLPEGGIDLEYYRSMIAIEEDGMLLTKVKLSREALVAVIALSVDMDVV